MVIPATIHNALLRVPHPSRGYTLAAVEPIVLEPVMDDGLLTIRVPELGIDVYAESQEELSSELAEQVLMLWEEYAREEDGRLSPAARNLKSALLRAFVEEPHAAPRPPG